jgi:hypothetical protein
VLRARTAAGLCSFTPEEPAWDATLVRSRQGAEQRERCPQVLPERSVEHTIEGVDGAPSLDPLRSVAARRARSRNRGIEAERSATEWPEFAPQTSLGDGALGAAQAADRQIARLYAQRARALAEFCAARPASVDRAQGEPGGDER